VIKSNAGKLPLTGVLIDRRAALQLALFLFFAGI